MVDAVADSPAPRTSGEADPRRSDVENITNQVTHDQAADSRIWLIMNRVSSRDYHVVLLFTLDGTTHLEKKKGVS